MISVVPRLEPSFRAPPEFVEVFPEKVEFVIVSVFVPPAANSMPPP